MKYIWLLVPLMLTSCASVNWVTVDPKGQIISENKQSVEILGNPVMACYNWKNQQITEGYFVRQQEDSSFLIDEFGKGFKIVENPNCRLGNGK